MLSVCLLLTHQAFLPLTAEYPGPLTQTLGATGQAHGQRLQQPFKVTCKEPVTHGEAGPVTQGRAGRPHG